MKKILSLEVYSSTLFAYFQSWNEESILHSEYPFRERECCFLYEDKLFFHYKFDKYYFEHFRLTEKNFKKPSCEDTYKINGKFFNAKKIYKDDYLRNKIYILNLLLKNGNYILL